MTGDPRPDSAEEDLAEQIDNVVPSYGYRKLPLVGLGGSAGSIEALQTFFTTMPPRSGFAFAVVIHLSPEHESTLSELLQRSTRMNVVRVDAPVQVQADTVYVIAPGRALKAVGEQLEAADLLGERAGRVAVDIFFRSLADSHGAHAAAVVLSGADGDGAIGIKRIKERGGLTVAQDPGEALHGAMPQSAVDTGMVDWVLPVRDMPARLMSFFRLEKAIILPAEEVPVGSPPSPAAQSEEDDLRDVLAFLRTRTGRDFSHYKRATVLRRIGRRMQVNGIDNLASYLNCLRTRTGECQALLQDLLITVTNFFRDSECFAALESNIPALFEGKGPNDTVRVWCVACATGEEAYSMAMLLTEYARRLEAPPNIQIFATDLDAEAIQIARDGVYLPAIVADVNEERLRRFFTKEHRGYRVRRELREMVLFAMHDVLKDSPFSRLDLISCRNLLIYLRRDAQARVFDTLHFALLPGGKLFLGASESVDDATPLFTVLDKKHRIYMQRPTTRSGLPVPSGSATLKLALETQHHAQESSVLALRGVVEQPSSTAARPSRVQDGGRTISWGEVHLRLLEHLAPPTILVNREHDILHLSPSAGRYLQMGGGEPTRNLLRSVHPNLRIELRAALYRAAQSGHAVILPSTPVTLGEVPVMLSVRVEPTEDIGEELFIVSFEREAAADCAELQSAQSAAEADPLARHLDREIERLKIHLRDTVEQYEASTEELKASNEELQAMNEELRSATEELETSREELQSINEELTTVNQELKSKVEELSHANSDMHNLMDATSIATVFLDRELRITRYTPSAVHLFNLIPTDIGRPLSDLSSQLDYLELAADAQRVLDKLVPVEREVGQAGGGWYLARLVPYRTIEDRIAGVVFSFIDITERKHAEEMRLWLSAVVTASSDAIMSFSLDHTILSWNAGAERIFGFGAEEAIGQPLAILGPDDGTEQERLVAKVARGQAVENVEVRRRRKDGTDVYVALTLSPIKDSSGRVMAGTAMARDITAARAAAESLRQTNEQLHMLIENAVDYAIFSMDLERRIVTWNTGAQRLLGFTQAEAIGMSADVVFTEADRAAGAPQRETELALRAGRAADERRHRRKDGSEFWGSGISMPMRNDRNEVVGFVKILRDLDAHVPHPSA